MGIVSALMALVLAGAGDPPAQATAPQGTTFQVSVLEMDSLAWRSAILHKMHLVGQQGGATVWTIDSQTARALQKHAQRMVAHPRMTTAAPGARASAHLSPEPCVFVASLKREANGPRHHATKPVVFHEQPGTIPEGWHIDLEGQPSSQGPGTLTHLSCQATWVTSLHDVTIPEIVCDEDGFGETLVTADVQVPEVASCHVSGQWLVPEGQVLLVSLGAHTSVDSKRLEALMRENASAASACELSKAVQITERLVIVEPNPAGVLPSPSSPIPAAIEPRALPDQKLVIRLGPDGPFRFEAAVPPPATLPAPSLPTPSLPMAGPAPIPSAAPDLGPLPPLPDEQVKPASMSAAGAPSAPAIKVSGRLTFDPSAGSACARVNTQTRCCEESKTSALDSGGKCPIDCDAPKTPMADVAPRTRIVRIPLGGNLAVEIKTTVEPVKRP